MNSERHLCGSMADGVDDLLCLVNLEIGLGSTGAFSKSILLCTILYM